MPLGLTQKPLPVIACRIRSHAYHVACPMRLQFHHTEKKTFTDLSKPVPVGLIDQVTFMHDVAENRIHSRIAPPWCSFSTMPPTFSLLAVQRPPVVRNTRGRSDAVP